MTARERSGPGWSPFATFATWSSRAVGSVEAFSVAVFVCVVWAAVGPYYGYSDTWQLVINTGTTVLTFLVVFLIQYSQNRDATAIQLKLDELLRAIEGARTGMVDLEARSDAELRRLKDEFAALRLREGPIDDAHAPAENGRGRRQSELTPGSREG